MTFEQTIRAYGLRPRGVVAPGREERCPTESKPRRRNGWWKLAPDGLIGWFEDHGSGDGVVTWRPDEETAATLPPAPDYAAIRRRQQQERRERAAAVRAARLFYQDAAPLFGGHPYLERKGLDMTGARGLKVDADGWLVVPMMRRGGLVSVQRIAPDGAKRFWKGAPSMGVWWDIERPGAMVTVLAEGLATGLAIFAAAPLCRVVICFTAGNLARVADAREWRGNVVVAADNDHETAGRIGKNPGVDAANEAAEIIGCGVMVPQQLGPGESDWCDYRQAEISRRRDAVTGYGRAGETEGTTVRAVDSMIAMEVQRAMRFVVPNRRTA